MGVIGGGVSSFGFMCCDAVAVVRVCAAAVDNSRFFFSQEFDTVFFPLQTIHFLSKEETTTIDPAKSELEANNVIHR